MADFESVLEVTSSAANYLAAVMTFSSVKVSSSFRFRLAPWWLNHCSMLPWYPFMAECSGIQMLIEMGDEISRDSCNDSRSIDLRTSLTRNVIAKTSLGMIRFVDNQKFRAQRNGDNCFDILPQGLGESEYM